MSHLDCPGCVTGDHSAPPVRALRFLALTVCMVDVLLCVVVYVLARKVGL